MTAPVYIAKEYENLNYAIEMAQVIARASKVKKATLNFRNAVFEVSAEMSIKEAIDKYLAVKDKLFNEQKEIKR